MQARFEVTSLGVGLFISFLPNTCKYHSRFYDHCEAEPLVFHHINRVCRIRVEAFCLSGPGNIVFIR